MPNKEDIREQILQAAQRLFTRYGPIKTSVADIARELGMSPANIYNFFPSRNALVEAVGERDMSMLGRRIEREVERIPDPWERIARLFLVVSLGIRERLGNEKDMLQLQALSYRQDWRFVATFNDFLRRQVALAVRDGLDGGRFRTDGSALRGRDAEAIAGAIFDCMATSHEPGLLLRVPPDEHEARVRAQLELLEAALT